MLLTLLAFAFPSRVRAHPRVDEGVRHQQAGDFDEALSALGEAWEADDLDRDALLRLLETRAMVHYALGRAADVEQDMRHLAALDPDHDFPPEVPPELRLEFDMAQRDVRGRVEITARPSESDEGVVIRAWVMRDPTELVRSVRVHARPADESRWRTAPGQLVVESGDGEGVEYYATAIGPGGALVARSGSAQRPHRVGGVFDPERGEDEPCHDCDRTWLWAGVAAAGAAAVGLSVAAVVLLGGGGSSRTQPSAPVYVGGGG